MRTNTGIASWQALAVGISVAGLAAFVVAQQSAGGHKQVSGSGQVSGSVSGGGSASGSVRAGGTAAGGQNAHGGGHAFGMGIDPNKNLFAVWYENARPSPDAERQHTSHMKYLMQDRTLVAEGPFKDQSGYMLILQAKTLEEATSAVQGDPAVKSGALKVTLKPWKWRFGGVSDGLVRPPVSSSGKIIKRD